MEHHPCNQCEYVSKSAYNLKYHKDKQHSGISYSCSQCNYSSTHPFVFRQHVKAHRESSHNALVQQQQNQKQDVGNSDSVAKNSSVELAYRTPSTDPGRPPERKKMNLFPCSQCSFVAFGKRMLVQHEFTHVKGTFACPQCGLQFNVLSQVGVYIVHFTHPPNPMRFLGLSSCL